jgi:hypothetical protein
MKNKYQYLHEKLHRLKTQNTDTRTDNIQFYPRVINNTNINFTDEENALLQKGLKNNLHAKPKQWIQKLAMEAETAITLLPPPDQNPVRYLIAKNLERLAHNNKQRTSQNKNIHTEKRIINGIRNKLYQNNAVITKADKGNSIIIIDKTEYELKILQFLNSNHFQMKSRDPTNRFQAEIRKSINSCPIIIPTSQKWKYINMNPSPPNIKGLIKIHKTEAPI